ncbi:MAG: YhjD/YihY/BrkB family envelope integrity protein [Parachlamydiaceae bacterium]|nr:YhjD/YihY/BrkB family envelope integrity protein [Parachlamydiaceae bacterium]
MTNKTYSELYLHQNDTNEEKHIPTTFWKRVWRVLKDSARGFIEDDCYAKASALTFYTLLSIVPVLAVLFGIAKGFGFEGALEKEINETFYEQKELVAKLIQFAYSWLQSVKGGVIAGVGSIALLWSVFGLLNNIETALNSIWKTRFSRPYTRKISDYLATMIICPIFLVTVSSINVYLNTQIVDTAQNYMIVQAVSPFLLSILKLFPYFLSIILFSFVYLFMPNTQVYIRSALIAGIIGGSAFQLWQWIYIRFQIGVSSYGAIYGSFAALPLFLIWLQISWLILLAGAEIAFEIENDLFVPYRRLVPISSKAAILLIAFRCIESFAKGEKPQTERDLSHELGISLYHLQTLLSILQKEGILSAITYQDSVSGYQPARAIDSITYVDVLNALDKSDELLASIKDSQPFKKINQFLNEFDDAVKKTEGNQPIYKSLSSTFIPTNESK